MTRGTPEQIATPVISCSLRRRRSVRHVDAREREREAVEAEELLHHRARARRRCGRRRSRCASGRRGRGPRNNPTTVWVFPASIVEQHVGRCSSADVETDVEHPHRVRERTHRDEVGAGLGVRAHRVEGDATRHLDLGAARRGSRPPCGPRRGSCCRASTTSTPASRASATWSSVSHSTSTIAHRPARPRPVDRLREPERGEVIVLDQHRRRERVAMVEPAAGAYRRALHAAQAGQASCGCRGCAPCRARRGRSAGSATRRPSSDRGS